VNPFFLFIVATAEAAATESADALLAMVGERRIGLRVSPILPQSGRESLVSRLYLAEPRDKEARRVSEENGQGRICLAYASGFLVRSRSLGTSNTLRVHPPKTCLDARWGQTYRPALVYLFRGIRKSFSLPATGGLWQRALPEA
jgi:hypothetical protein